MKNPNPRPKSLKPKTEGGISVPGLWPENLKAQNQKIRDIIIADGSFPPEVPN